MKYIVLDLEWNQSRHPRETVKKPLYLTGEIVQIGAVRMNRKFRIEKELRLAVLPQYYKKVHKKVSQITGLNNEDLKKGLPFPDAWRKLSKFCGKDYVFLTWGPDDLPMLRDNLILHGIDTDKLPPAYDLQVIFADQIAHQNRQFALSQAIEMLGEADFEAHDALNDAHSTALVCRHLNMEEGFSRYAALTNEITQNPLESREVGIRYPNKLAALRELASTPFFSPDGSDFLTPSTLVPQNPSKYLAVATGENGEEYLVRFRLMKNREGAVWVNREIFAMNEEVRIFYEDKVKKHKERKPRKRKKKKTPQAAMA